MRVTSLDIHIRFDDDKTIIRQIERRSIESIAGRAHEMHVVYDNPRYRLKDASLRIIDDSGAVLSEYDRKQMYKICGYDESSTLYSDDCRFMADPGISRFPLRMELETVHELPGNFMLSEVFTQRPWPVDKLSIALEVRTDIQIRWKWYGSPSPVPPTGTGVMNWSLDSIPAWKPHEYISSSVRPLQLLLQSDRVRFGKQQYELATWDDVAQMYRALAADRYLVSDHVSSVPISNRMLDGIYLEQISKIRYVSVNRKLSGWQTEPAATVEKVGYGDCKGSSTLLVSRFRSAGAQAYPVLVLTRGEGVVDPEFVTDNFNHVITMAVVGQDTLWYDPTCTLCPPGELPESDEGTLALIVGDSNGTLVTLPKSTALDNRTTTTSHMNIDSAGQVQVKCVTRYAGNNAVSSRYVLHGKTHRERIDSFNEFLAGRQSEFRLDSMVYLNESDLHLPLEREVYLTRKKTLSQKGTAFFNPYIFSRASDYDMLLAVPDSLPVDLGYPRGLLDSCVLTGQFIERADSIHLPPPDSATFPGGEFSLQWKRAGDTLVGIWKSELFVTQQDSTALAEIKRALQTRKRLLTLPVRFFSSEH